MTTPTLVECPRCGNFYDLDDDSDTCPHPRRSGRDPLKPSRVPAGATSHTSSQGDVNAMNMSPAVEQTEQYVAEVKRRKELIQGLRELADFLENNTDVPVPWGQDIVVPSNPDQVRAAARIPGTKVKAKTADGPWFGIRHEFTGGVTVDFYTAREQICKKRVVGTKKIPEQVQPARTEEIVEWDCEPLFADVPENQSASPESVEMT